MTPFEIAINLGSKEIIKLFFQNGYRIKNVNNIIFRVKNK